MLLANPTAIVTVRAFHASRVTVWPFGFLLQIGLLSRVEILCQPSLKRFSTEVGLLSARAGPEKAAAGGTFLEG
jgi:hypothetical protein